MRVVGWCDGGGVVVWCDGGGVVCWWSRVCGLVFVVLCWRWCAGVGVTHVVLCSIAA